MERRLTSAAIIVLLLAAVGFTGARADYHIPASAASAAGQQDYRSHLRGDDADGDGHDSIASGGDDCDDQDPRRHPGRYEIADFNGHDEDCDSHTYGDLDKDRDGFTDSRVYNRDERTGEIFRGEDCNDNNRSVHPLASEVCDMKDNNCDGKVDEDVRPALYVDADGDGFGAGQPVFTACHAGPVQSKTKGNSYNLSSFNTDCDDADPLTHPGQFERPDGRDNDCNGTIDESATLTSGAVRKQVTALMRDRSCIRRLERRRESPPLLSLARHICPACLTNESDGRFGFKLDLLRSQRSAL